MNIIIVGCGKVGNNLTKLLIKENHNISVIDEKPEKIAQITDSVDAIGIVGNGINQKTLDEAGISTADLLIAVTGDDEKNLLCCVIARRRGHCKTIARVTNPIYTDDVDFLRNELGVSMIINPERTAADEIARIFQFPSAIRVDTFAKGRIDLLHYKLTEESPLIGTRLMDFHKNFNTDVLVCTVIRGDEVIIPNGSYEFMVGDMIAIAATRRSAVAFFKKVGNAKNRITSALIAGGGKISFYLTKTLLASGMDVTVIEVNKAICESFSEALPGATVICGDATDENVLLEEGLPDAKGFAALTGLDEENILLSLFAREVSKAKTVTKVNRISFNSVVEGLDLGSTIHPCFITANHIFKFVRSMSTSANSSVEKLYRLADGKAEALEFTISQDSAIVGTPIMDLKLKKNTLIASIYRNKKVITPSGQDKIFPGDSVLVVISGYSISDIEEILEV